MPTARAAAALRYLKARNRYYQAFWQEHEERLGSGASLNISSYDLFIMKTGIECAMFPYLYPRTEFTDTGIMQHYQHVSEDTSRRVCSIGLSWTRKVLSSARVYGEQRDLAFFLYEKHLAQWYFCAQVRAKQMGVTGDVMARDSQASAGYFGRLSRMLWPISSGLC